MKPFSLPLSHPSPATDVPVTPDTAGAALRSGFRHHLRRATAPQHEAAEAAFAPLTADLGQGLRGFLCAQRQAFATLAAAPSPAQISHQITLDLLDRLDRDLGPRTDAPQDPPPLDPLAVDYLVLGSRLGTEVLRRRLLDEMPDVTLPMYFRAPPATAEWQRVCAALDGVTLNSAPAARIEIDVRRGFDIFAAAAYAASEGQGSTEGQP
ncbi:hypothetical protein [Ponticoccus litoralis]|uniref:Heme oxygenase n=1 Tax=Ponticoccus litoralis TaxID=422297 RepID=A0AAW9SS33_9RHOB